MNQNYWKLKVKEAKEEGFSEGFKKGYKKAIQEMNDKD